MQRYNVALSKQRMEVHVFSVVFLSNFRGRSWVTVVYFHAETLADSHECLAYFACTDDTDLFLVKIESK